METVIQIKCTPDELIEKLRAALDLTRTSKERQTGTLSELVPYVTKNQAARILKCSAAYINRLEASGDLPRQDTPRAEKYRMEDVLACLAQGKTGRKQHC